MDTKTTNIVTQASRLRFHSRHVGTGATFTFSRRNFLGGSLGGFFSFAMAHHGQRLLAAAGAERTAKRLLVIWADGGPSQLDTFDPKPGRETGGERKSIETSVAGLEISETLPRLAKQMNKLSVIRNLSSREGQHERAKVYLHTGYKPVEAFPRPALGAVVSHGAPNSDLPNYVSIGSPGFGPAYLGLDHVPFSIEDAARARNLLQTLESRRSRIRLTRKLSENFSASRASAGAASRLAVLSGIEKLIETPFADALDVAAEPESVLQRYGDGAFAGHCVLARRLLETGVSFVEIHHAGWDTHQQNAQSTARLCGEIDQPWAALMEDLAARGLLEETIVMWLGEFGRTPQINGTAGRDHFPQVTPVVIGGGGFAGGEVIGRTNKDGTAIEGDSHGVADLFATVLSRLGVSPDREYETDFGSMTKATDDGKVITGI